MTILHSQCPPLKNLVVVWGVPGEKVLVQAAKNMRAMDADEVMAAEGRTPLEALSHACQRSTLCWTVLVEGAPAIVCGVAPAASLLGSVGSPWMLGTQLFTQASKLVARRAREAVGHMQDLYPFLYNYTLAENIQAHRFLRWCGFTLAEFPEPYGQQGKLFYPFWR